MFQLIISYDGKEYRHGISNVCDLDNLLKSEIIDKKASTNFVDDFHKPIRVRYNYYLKDKRVVINVICSILDNKRIGSVDSITVQYNGSESCDIKVIYSGLELSSSYFDNPLYDTICETRKTREIIENYGDDKHWQLRNIAIAMVETKDIVVREKVDCKDIALMYKKKSFDLARIPDKRIMEILTKVDL